MIDPDALLSPTEHQPPCGPNLEYDPAFFAVEVALRARQSDRADSGEPPADIPDWRDVLVRAQALLRTTKDLRLAVWLTRALTHTNGFPGLAAGLAVVQGLLVRYWSDLYPRLEADRDDDSTERVNALAPLADPGGLIGDVRATLLGDSSERGDVEVRDLEMALGRLRPVGPKDRRPVRSLDEIDAHLATGLTHDFTLRSAIRMAHHWAESIQAALVARLGPELPVDLRPLTELLDILRVECDIALRRPLAPPRAVHEMHSETRSIGTADSVGTTAIRRRERADVARALEQVHDYFAQHEPAHPAPSLIRRALRLMTGDSIPSGRLEDV